MKVGFIGLGRMGKGMVRNLLKAGIDLVVYDINPEVKQSFANEGAQPAQTVAEIAGQCSLIFTSLPGPSQVEEVLLGKDGLLEHINPGSAVFDLSTSSLPLAQKASQAFVERGAHMLDAPVSGGPAGAASGNMVIWVGGDHDAFDLHLPILKAFASTPHYVGPIGSGTITKLAHNALGYMIQLAQAEVFSLAVKAGLDALDLWEALRLGVVGKGSPLDMLTNQFLPGQFETAAFALKLGHKDIGLAASLARELGVPMRMANMTLEEMTEAISRGYGDWDSRAYMQLQLERAGVKIAIEPSRLQKVIERIHGIR